MSELLKLNVNDHTEKKNGLTYLSWAWAWAKVLEIDPQATWEAVEFNGAPCTFLPDGSAMVKVLVTIKGHAKSCWLPVMDHRNKAIKNPDAFAVNTALVRCLTKCISMHGLGLYIYAGEDLPDGEEKPEPEPGPKSAPVIPARPATESMSLSPEVVRELEELAERVKELAKTDPAMADETIRLQRLEGDQEIALANMMDSTTRAAIRKARAAYMTKMKQEAGMTRA